MIDGPWARGTLKEMAPHREVVGGANPAVGSLKPRFTMSSWYYVAFAPSQVREESKKFVKFLLEPENMARSVVTIPGRKSAAAMARFQTPDWKPWIDAAPYGERCHHRQVQPDRRHRGQCLPAGAVPEEAGQGGGRRRRRPSQ